MIIYLDESKQLAKWKIVLWWFITKINTNTLNKYLKEKILDDFIRNNNFNIDLTKTYTCNIFRGFAFLWNI